MSAPFDPRSLQQASADQLRATIDRVSAESGGIVDCRATLARLGGDIELFRDLLRFVFQDAPELSREIHEAIQSCDCERLMRSAHRLKGLISNLDAHPAIQAASRLEMIGRKGELSEAPAAFDALQRELERMFGELREFCRPGS